MSKKEPLHMALIWSLKPNLNDNTKIAQVILKRLPSN